MSDKIPRKIMQWDLEKKQIPCKYGVQQKTWRMKVMIYNKESQCISNYDGLASWLNANFLLIHLTKKRLTKHIPSICRRYDV